VFCEKAHKQIGDKKFPEGVRSWHYPRKQNPVVSVLSIIFSLIIWNYVFWGVGGVFILLSFYLAGIISWYMVKVIFVVYTLQLLLYYPQYGRGWSPLWEYVLKSSVCDLGLCYLDAWMVQESPLDPQKRYVFGWAPHGLLGVCRAASGGSWWRAAFPEIRCRWGSFGMAFFIPGIREFSLLTGACDASKDVLVGRIKDGEGVHLIPGGIREMMLTDENSTDTKVVLKGRMGFVRLAWEHGLDLVPVFCFGEKWTSKKVLLPGFIRQIMAKFRMAGTALVGKWSTLLPLTHHPKHGELSIGWVFGRPIMVKKREPAILSEEEEEEIRVVFEDLDKNKDDMIDAKDIKDFLERKIMRPSFERFGLKRLQRELSREEGTVMDLSQFTNYYQGEKAIVKLHEEFMAEIKRIFSTYKDQFGFSEESLTIVDTSYENLYKKD